LRFLKKIFKKHYEKICFIFLEKKKKRKKNLKEKIKKIFYRKLKKKLGQKLRNDRKKSS